MRVELGKSGHVADMSMLRKDQIKANEAADLENDKNQKNSVDQDKGLLDVTDLKNEDFIYVY